MVRRKSPMYKFLALILVILPAVLLFVPASAEAG
jgi:hypothetical protein